MSTYLLINIGSVFIPLVLSFDRKVHYYKRWKYLFPAIFITLIFFIIWDIFFTAKGIWGFNPIHLSGIEIVNLPLGEWLFFVTVPYASVFLYDVFKAYIKKDLLKPYSGWISAILIIFLFTIALFNTNKIYTSITFALLGSYLIIFQYILRVDYMGRFYFAYLFVLLPFLLVNGILTGSFIEEPVVWYNDNENLGIRLFTIPVEDAFYGLLLILMNVSIYEKLQKLY